MSVLQYNILQVIATKATKSIHIIIQELMNLLHGNKFSPWEDFFVNPFGSDGRVLVWDATCADTPTPSHQAMAARESRAVAVDAEQWKKSKYSHLETTHCFVPVAVETLGAMGPEARSFFPGNCQPHQVIMQ